MLWDNGATTKLTDGQFQPQIADLSETGLVVWDHRAGPLASGIQIWEQGLTTDLTHCGAGPSVNDAGQISFYRWHDDTANWQQWLYRDGAFWQLSNDPFWNHSGQVNRSGEVAWESGPTFEADIRYLCLLPTGDLNCDGAFDGADIDVFFLALGDPLAYASAFPNCDRMLADMNSDGAVDGADIDAFFVCLGSGRCP